MQHPRARAAAASHVLCPTLPPTHTRTHTRDTPPRSPPQSYSPPPVRCRAISRRTCGAVFVRGACRAAAPTPLSGSVCSSPPSDLHAVARLPCDLGGPGRVLMASSRARPRLLTYRLWSSTPGPAGTQGLQIIHPPQLSYPATLSPSSELLSSRLQERERGRRAPWSPPTGV